MSGPFQGYWFECKNCGFLASNLTPSISEESTNNAIDETYRLKALQHLRLPNFERILDRLEILSAGKHLERVLDVGCAHGWFLQAATRRGYAAIGIEPDSVIASQAQANGVSVILGFFPSDLHPDSSFDIITFNDVFEHIPNPQAAANACFDFLAPGGMLAVTLPNSHGTLFWLARKLSAIGFVAPLNRLWQRDFPSPHLSYFHPEALAAFLLDHGFKEICRDSLPSLTQRGLWQRLRYDRRSSMPISAILYILFYLFTPLLTLLPPDISFQVFERMNDD